MTPDQDARSADESMRGAVLVCVTATLAGMAIGFVGGAFRWLLDVADRLRFDFVEWSQRLPGPGWLIPVAAAAAGATGAAPRKPGKARGEPKG